MKEENPNQTLSDFAVDFYVVRPGVLHSLTLGTEHLYSCSNAIC
jgi:hypothetical protein